MKRFVTLLILGTIGWFVYSGYHKYHKPAMKSDGQAVVIERPNNKWVFADNGDTQAELRIFGFNDEPMGTAEMGPFAVNTHLFIVAPMAESAEIFRRQFCEKGAIDIASQVNIIASDKAVFNKVEAFRKSSDSRKCARIAGKSLLLKQEFYKGEELTNWSVSSSMPYDGRKFILMSSFEPVACQ